MFVISIFRSFEFSIRFMHGVRHFEAKNMISPVSAVVTGANKGIGFEICKQLLAANVSVVVTGRDVGRGEQAVSALKQYMLPSGREHLVAGFVQLDVGDDASVVQARDEIASLVGGKLDILVNNAGTAYLDRTFGEDEARHTINVNTFGTMRVTRALMPLLAQQSPHDYFHMSEANHDTADNNHGVTSRAVVAGRSKSGRIVNVASIESSLSDLSPSLRKRFLDPTLTDMGLAALMDEFVTSKRTRRRKRGGVVPCTGLRSWA